MTATSTLVRYTLEEMNARNAAGLIFIDEDAPEAPTLGKEFWSTAVVTDRHMNPKLTIDPDLYRWFASEGDAQAKMNEVLRQYYLANK